MKWHAEQDIKQT